MPFQALIGESGLAGDSEGPPEFFSCRSTAYYKDRSGGRYARFSKPAQAPTTTRFRGEEKERGAVLFGDKDTEES
jgi:hypothetical protein